MGRNPFFFFAFSPEKDISVWKNNARYCAEFSVSGESEEKMPDFLYRSRFFCDDVLKIRIASSIMKKRKCVFEFFSNKKADCIVLIVKGNQNDGGMDQ